jgi:type III secretion protein W
MSDLSGATPIDPSQRAAAAEMREEASTGRLARMSAARTQVKENLSETLAESFNPFQADRETQFKSLQERQQHVPKSTDLIEGTKIRKISDAETSAERYSQRNPELEKQKLLALLASLRDSDSSEEILARVLESFSDPSLADEALEFLQETTSGRVQEAVKGARQLLNEQKPVDVAAGRNMGAESRQFSAEKNLGKPGELRDLYRDVVGNPRDHNALFDELSKAYKYDQLKDVINFLFSSLGSDLRSKGPSIPRGELYRLMTETKVLQSILGVYSFFEKRFGLVSKMLTSRGLPVPRKLTFESMAKLFMQLVEERYPSSMKILRSGQSLGLSSDLIAQLIVYEQFRDAIRGVSPRIYRSLKHRYDLLMAILEALEELEEELDEEEEEEEEEGG